MVKSVKVTTNRATWWLFQSAPWAFSWHKPLWWHPDEWGKLWWRASKAARSRHSSCPQRQTRRPCSRSSSNSHPSGHQRVAGHSSAAAGCCSERILSPAYQRTSYWSLTGVLSFADCAVEGRSLPAPALSLLVPPCILSLLLLVIPCTCHVEAHLLLWVKPFYQWIYQTHPFFFFSSSIKRMKI